MKFNPYDIEPKLIVSDSLKGVLPEEQLQEVDEMFISIGLVLDPKEHSLMGNLVAIEFSDNLRMQVKLSLRDVFNFISNVITNKNHNKVCNGVIMLMGSDSTMLQGPYNIKNIKIVEIESENKLCIVEIDLSKDTP